MFAIFFIALFAVADEVPNKPEKSPKAIIKLRGEEQSKIAARKAAQKEKEKDQSAPKSTSKAAKAKPAEQPTEGLAESVLDAAHAIASGLSSMFSETPEEPKKQRTGCGVILGAFGESDYYWFAVEIGLAIRRMAMSSTWCGDETPPKTKSGKYRVPVSIFTDIDIQDLFDESAAGNITKGTGIRTIDASHLGTPPFVGSSIPAKVARHRWYVATMFQVSPYQRSVYVDLEVQLCGSRGLQLLFDPLLKGFPLALNLDATELALHYDSVIMKHEFMQRVPGVIAIDMGNKQAQDCVRHWANSLADPNTIAPGRELYNLASGVKGSKMFTDGEVCRGADGGTCAEAMSLSQHTCYIINSLLPQRGRHWTEEERKRKKEFE